jgi:glycerol-3-phosphate acyltransferase PlsY
MYPVWLRFEGGKGVATGLGAFATLAPRPALVAVAAFALGSAASRTVSIGSVAGALTLAVATVAWGGWGPAGWAAVATAALVVLRHRENLRRLLGGRPGGAGSREA